MVSAFKNRTKYDKIKKLQHSDHYPAAAYRSRTPRRPEQETERKIMEFTMDIFKQFDKKWALVTAGDQKKFNTMTVSWGGLGTIWGRPVATVYIRKSRYTHEFMDEKDTFTVSFYPEKYRKVLGVLGAKSGREMDKMHASGLTPKFLADGVTFEEAEVTLVCRKLFCQPMPEENIPQEILSQYYQDHDIHDMYIGEVIEIL